MYTTRVYDGSMTNRTGWIWVALPMIWAGQLFAQRLGNQTLTGKYYLRHVSLGTDGKSLSSSSSTQQSAALLWEQRGRRLSPGLAFTGC